MAELKVEPKKSSPVWWIILIIIVILIILYFVFRGGNKRNGGMNTSTDSTGMIQNKINSDHKTIFLIPLEQNTEITITRS